MPRPETARKSITESILRAGESKSLREIKKLTDKVNSLEGNYTDLTDGQLRAKTDEFKERYQNGESLDALLPEAFAVVREASHRVLGQRQYDVQVMGGIALHNGMVSQMATGEGKTLTATMPAYLNALAGQGVHVVTVNDYLAKRDAEWMGDVYKFLGLSVGVILPNRPSAEHKAAYDCDITYGTANEFGFDYLRDNMVWSVKDRVQRGHSFAIVDEVDSILIDQARTPLIIAGSVQEQASRWYTEFSRLAKSMKEGIHYEVDLGKHTVAITEKGVSTIEDQLGIDNLYNPNNTPLIQYLNNSLKAKELFHKDKEYIVHNGEVLIVDEFTGRILYGRRYNEGLHQAIEAKEKVNIKSENQTVARITLQNYFRLYEKLSGMTGTVETEAAEFHRVYNVNVVSIPTHRPLIREDKPDVIYKTKRAKFNAVLEDIVERHAKGQPILVGTIDIEQSEILSAMLRRRQLPHTVLNAKNHAKEAEIIAQAGSKGAITIATNMAGRGVDILLGGNPEHLARAELTKRGLSEEENPKAYNSAYSEALERWTTVTENEAEEVIDAGGLYVLGTERHESRRIDNQLRGRSGRQGDPGETRFYLSLQDGLMKRYNTRIVKSVMDRLRIPDDTPITSKRLVTNMIRNAQTQVEQVNAEVRKDVLKYDESLNKQRSVIYQEREKILTTENIREIVHGLIADVVDSIVSNTVIGDPDHWDLDTLWKTFRNIHPLSFSIDDLIAESGDDRSLLTPEFVIDMITEDLIETYDKRMDTNDESSEATRDHERQILLQVLDNKWREHLYEMDSLRDGVGLRAYAQRDPLVEYNREGFDMFQAMIEGFKEEAVSWLFHTEPPKK